MPPRLIITRPAPAGPAFAEKVTAALGQEIDTIHAPAFRITYHEVAVPDHDELVFTSANGVAAAQHLGLVKGQTAWCVGDRTAAAAAAAGYLAKSAQGDAAALIAMIVKDRPENRLLHVGGAHTRGNVAGTLTAAGIQCQSVTAYRQTLRAPTQELIAALQGNDALVSPVFSPRSAAPLTLPNRNAPLHGVAISPAVGEVLTALPVDTLLVVEKPDEASMIAGTCAVLRQLLDRC